MTSVAETKVATPSLALTFHLLIHRLELLRQLRSPLRAPLSLWEAEEELLPLSARSALNTVIRISAIIVAAREVKCTVPGRATLQAVHATMSSLGKAKRTAEDGCCSNNDDS